MLATFVVSNSQDSGSGSLRGALELANNNADSDLILFDLPEFARFIHLTSGPLEVWDKVTIGESGRDYRISISGSGRAFIIDDPALQNDDFDVRFIGLSLNNGIHSESRGELAIEDCLIERAAPSFIGSGIHAATAQILVTDSFVRRNTGRMGGGVYTDTGTVVLENTLVQGNTGLEGGGGIFADSGTVILNNSAVNGNISLIDGGGVKTNDGTVIVTNSSVNDNQNFMEGGGIKAGLGDITISGSVIRGNGGGSVGGGLFARGGVVTIAESSISGNATSDLGGGISAYNGRLNVSRSEIYDNSSHRGGGISTFTTMLTVSESSIRGNIATADGGGIQATFGELSISNSTLSGNHSDGDGGGIVSSFASLAVSNSTISGNSSSSRGGGISSLYGSVSLTNTTSTGNSAVQGGGLFGFAAFLTGFDLAINNTVVAGNVAADGPDLMLTASNLTLEVDFSLIGDNSGTPLEAAPVGFPDAHGNFIGTSTNSIDPLLDILSDNGGFTRTHSLIPGSPLIDLGDPNATAGENGLPEFDQRGLRFVRVSNRRLDIGAFEVQAFDGDFDRDGDYDCADVDSLAEEIATGSTDLSFDLNGDGTLSVIDLAVWLVQAGGANNPSGQPYQSGDANLDGSVDVSDFNRWNENKFSTTFGWCSGDFNADGVVDVSDFNVWNEYKFTSSNASVSVQPGPSGARLKSLAIYRKRESDESSVRDKVFGDW